MIGKGLVSILVAACLVAECQERSLPFTVQQPQGPAILRPYRVQTVPVVRLNNSSRIHSLLRGLAAENATKHWVHGGNSVSDGGTFQSTSSGTVSGRKVTISESDDLAPRNDRSSTHLSLTHQPADAPVACGWPGA